MFLSPTDALHGDIGIVGAADLLVAFSKSGGSEELLKLLPFAKVHTTALCSLTCWPSEGCLLYQPVCNWRRLTDAEACCNASCSDVVVAPTIHLPLKGSL